MSKIFCPLEDGFITNRLVFESYEDAKYAFPDKNLVEETEETGPIIIGYKWDGSSCVEPTPEEIASYNAKYDVAIEVVEEI